MHTLRWLLSVPIALLVLSLGSPLQASAIRDNAKMFGLDAIEQAESRLDRIERITGVPVVIETIGAIPGLRANSNKDEKDRAINQLALEKDKQIHDEGIYILISRSEHLISNTLVRKYLVEVLPQGKRREIRDAFIPRFKEGDFSGGLIDGVKAIETALDGVKTKAINGKVPVKDARGAGVRGAAGGGSTMGTIFLIGGGILAVFLILRVLGGLFGRSSGTGYPNQVGNMGMPRPGMGPGGGPGYYGGGGYGGRGGGGFFSGLLGGLGGAMAGNWLYDQMSGRHGGTTSAGMGYGPENSPSSVSDQSDDAIIGADDDGGQGASWDDGDVGDPGGGDWGGGDAGGDWGGGGGDWGGGDGGGDW